MVTVSRTQNAGIFWPKQGLGPPKVRWVPIGSLPPALFSFPKRVPDTLPRSSAHGHPVELGSAGICFQLSGYYEPSTGGPNRGKIQSLPRGSSRHVWKRTGNGETTEEDGKRRDHGRGRETEGPRNRTGNGGTTEEDGKRRDHGTGRETEGPRKRTGNGGTTEQDGKRRDHRRGRETEGPRNRTGNGETTEEDGKRRDHGRGRETEGPRKRTGNGGTTEEDGKRRDHGRGRKRRDHGRGQKRRDHAIQQLCEERLLRTWN
uniref:Uncharacterized protein n=1 Tax=Macaca fascicularis TaxID=9541 RepID=Q9GMT7_MACFA|nr:hypothetical protein [Macaca fascicularis]